MANRTEQISERSFVATMFMFLVGSSLTIPLAAVAAKDAWISILLGMACSLCFALVYTRLCRRFPGQSLVQIAETVLGSWAGRLIGVLYAIYSLHLGALVLRIFIDFISAVALPRTPIVIIAVMMMSVVLWAAFAGIEVIGRCAMIILALVLSEVAASVLMMSKDFQYANLFPILDRGWSPIIEGGVEVTAFPFGETVLFAMIIPQLNRVGKSTRTVMLTLGFGALLLLIVNVRNLLILGDLSTRMIFASYTTYQYISISDFLDRVEPLSMFTLVLGGFIKICVCLYVASRSLADLIRPVRYRPLLIPLALLMIELSGIVYKAGTESVQFALWVWPWYSLPFQLLIPAALLAVAIFAGKKGTAGAIPAGR
ncbi:GerAB/ArcD/ProY family transporter [Cohnella soli]|uniref:Endospore germination permease n=1 Tax=Cohnella soli TaxID=425005 RepID=A0ABW0I3G4_9BACL